MSKKLTFNLIDIYTDINTFITQMTLVVNEMLDEDYVLPTEFGVYIFTPIWRRFKIVTLVLKTRMMVLHPLRIILQIKYKRLVLISLVGVKQILNTLKQLQTTIIKTSHSANN